MKLVIEVNEFMEGFAGGDHTETVEIDTDKLPYEETLNEAMDPWYGLKLKVSELDDGTVPEVVELDE